MFGKTSNGRSAKYQNVKLDSFSDDEDDVGHHAAENSAHGSSASGVGGIQEQLRVQDEGLEMLSQSADRLGKMSMAIHEELGHQNKMLDEMDQDLEQASENLDFVTRKTKEFIEKSGGAKNCVIIAALALVVVILVFLILYT